MCYCPLPTCSWPYGPTWQEVCWQKCWQMFREKSSVFLWPVTIKHRKMNSTVNIFKGRSELNFRRQSQSRWKATFLHRRLRRFVPFDAEPFPAHLDLRHLPVAHHGCRTQIHEGPEALQPARARSDLQRVPGRRLHIFHQSIQARVLAPLHLAVPSCADVRRNDDRFMVLFALETRRICRDRFLRLAQEAKPSVNSPCLPSY